MEDVADAARKGYGTHATDTPRTKAVGMGDGESAPRLPSANVVLLLQKVADAAASGRHTAIMDEEFGTTPDGRRALAFLNRLAGRLKL